MAMGAAAYQARPRRTSSMESTRAAPQLGMEPVRGALPPPHSARRARRRALVSLRPMAPVNRLPSGIQVEQVAQVRGRASMTAAAQAATPQAPQPD